MLIKGCGQFALAPGCIVPGLSLDDEDLHCAFGSEPVDADGDTLDMPWPVEPEKPTAQCLRKRAEAAARMPPLPAWIEF